MPISDYEAQTWVPCPECAGFKFKLGAPLGVRCGRCYGMGMVLYIAKPATKENNDGDTLE